MVDNTQKIVDVLETLTQSGVHIYSENGQLKTQSAKGALTEPLITLIKTNKLEILEYLNKIDADEKHKSRHRPKLEKRPTDQMHGVASYSQRRLWFIDQMEAGSQHYHIPVVHTYNGILNLTVAESAINLIIQRHEVLRTVFKAEQGTVFQSVRKNTGLSINHIKRLTDSIQIEPKQVTVETQKIIQQEISKPFDLQKDLMLRCSIIEQGENQGVILFVMHHIASDGLSVNNFVTEFSTIYNQLCQQEIEANKATQIGLEALPDLAVQYLDYSIWQRNWLDDAVLQSQLNYWKKQLDNLPDVHTLPLDRSRPPERTFNGQVLTFSIEKPIYDALMRLARTQQVTPFMLMHALFSLLIARYSGEADVVIGTPSANRAHQSLQPLIGFFVNTLVLRTDCQGELTFSELLKRVKATHLDMQSNQDMPFELIVDALNPKRSAAYSTLFQIMLMMDAQNQPSLALNGVDTQTCDYANIPAKFELTLDISTVSDGYKCTFLYNSDLFHQQTIQRLSQSFITLISAIVSTKKELGIDTKISELPVIGNGQLNQLIHEFNETGKQFTSGYCVHHLFEQQVELTPKSAAVIFENKVLNYSTLNEKANQLAHWLIEQKVSTQTQVGIYMQRSIEMIVAMFAVMKTGATYVPLDPSHPHDRVSDLLLDSEAQAILTQLVLLPQAEAFECATVLAIDHTDTQRTLAKYPAHNPDDIAIDDSEVAYIIYTSGSTGKPKGVAVEHRSIVNYMHAVDAYTSDSDGMVFVTNFCFDGTVTVLLPPFTKGQYLHIIAENDTQFKNLAQQIQRTDARLLFKLTPSFLDAVRGFIDEQQMIDNSIEHSFILGGESLYFETYDYWSTLLPKSRFINHYGPTEATVGCSVYPISGQLTEQQFSNGMPIGKPLANVLLYILDNNLKPVPMGCAGELFIGGLCLAKGYWNRPVLSKEKFLANPFIEKAGARMYRSGDLVRYLADGNIEFLGRIDHQVKLNGLRIELGEIESQINKLEDVDNCVVVLHQSESNTHKLVAYVATETTIDAGQFHEKVSNDLLAVLPEYMIPAVIIKYQQLPLNHSGKIDRKALSQLKLPELMNELTAFQPAKTQTEKELAQIWSRLLNQPVRKIGRYSDFFQLGGHSLLSVRLLAEVRNQFSIELAIRTVFQCAKLAELAKAIDQGELTELPPLLPVERSNNGLPASYAQQRLWFLDQMEGGSSHYNMPAAMYAKGHFNVSAAELAFNQIIQRHESLRTVFVNSEQGVKQIIQSDITFSITQIDLTALDTTQQEQAVSQAVCKDANAPFDLSKDLMLRISYLMLAPQKGVLLFNMHHIASDGWSVGLLLDEFVALYQHFLNADEQSSQLLTIEDCAVPELKVQYVDYACWQQQWLQDSLLEEQLKFWQQKLYDAPVVHALPLDYTRPKEPSYEGRLYTFELQDVDLFALNQCASKHSCTLFMLLHAAFGVLIAKYSNQADILIGSPVANRKDKQLEHLIGFFVNTIVLRTDCSGHQTFSDFLQQIKQTNLDAQANQDVPFELVVEHLNPARSTQHSPLFQIMFSMNNISQAQQLKLPGIELSPVMGVEDEQPITAKYDLTLNAVETDGTLRLSFEYDSALFNKDTIVNFSNSYADLLKQIINDSSTLISDLSVLNADQLAEVMPRTQHYAHVAKPYASVHAIFENQARINPLQTAVFYAGQTLNYDVLNKRSNQLAHYLISQGVSNDLAVGLYMERSVEMLIGILAILKSGAAYLPLDPAYPQARLTHMVNDSQSDFIICQSRLMPSFEATKNLNIVTFEDIYKDNAWSGLDTHDPELDRFSSHDLAYIIYTSGSTGTPKGVLIEHQALIAHITNVTQLLSIDSKDRVLQFASISFDTFAEQTFACLAVGACLYLKDQELWSDERFYQYVKDHQITLTDLTPAYLNELLSDSEAARTFWKNNTLRKIVVGGESLPIGVVKKWFRHSANKYCDLINAYGPTEATITCSAKLIESPDAVITIGNALQGRQLYILDAFMNPLPKGAIGELWIGGSSLARGYLNQVDQTAARFVNSPFLQQAIDEKTDNRIYQSGDLARITANGEIEYMGRVDDQIKIRGFRIELGEIEQQLSLQESVKMAAVAVFGAADSHQYLVAFVSLEHKQPSTAQQHTIDRLKEALNLVLPEYMLPRKYVVLQEFPMTANGKIDRKALSQYKLDLGISSYRAPENDTEKKLSEIWSEVLRIPLNNLSTEANFFELGGDSIISIQVVSRAAQHNLKVTIKQIFEYQSIRQLSAHVSHIHHDGLNQTQQKASKGSLPLLPIQKNFFENPVGLNHYNQSVLLKTSAIFNEKNLPLIVQALYQKHDVLRLRFNQRDNQWHGDFEPICSHMLQQSIPHRIVEVESFTEIATHANVLQSSLCLQKGPLFVAVLFRKPSGQGRLLLIAHHLLVDGVSWRIIQNDLRQLSQQLANGKKPTLSLKTTGYQQWGEFLHHYAHSEQLRKEREYWLATVNHDVSDLPIAISDAPSEQDESSNRYGLCEINLSASDTERLLTIASQAFRTQVNELLLSALLLVVHQKYNQSSLRIDLEGHGRQEINEDLDLSETVGWFTTIYPLVLSSASWQLEGLICSVKEQCRQVPQQGIGFGILKYIAGDQQLQDGNKSLILFNYLGQVNKLNNDNKLASENGSDYELLDFTFEDTGAYQDPRRGVEHGLNLNGIVINDVLNFTLTYDKRKYSSSAVIDLMQGYQRALEEIVEFCCETQVRKLTPSDFPLAKLTQAQLDVWQSQCSIENIYPATPMQQGLLFHSSIDQSAYVTQMMFTLDQGTDLAAFEQAWRLVSKRYAVLRTAFMNNHKGDLLQLVVHSTELPWDVKDIGQQSQSQQNLIIEKKRKADKLQGFEQQHAPLLRFTIWHLGDQSYRVLMTNHHALLDGWSIPIIFSDVVETYRKLMQSEPVNLPQVVPYGKYIQWLHKQSNSAAQRFWEAHLRGVESNTLLVPENKPIDPINSQSMVEYGVSLNPEQTQLIEQFSISCQVTINTLLQAAWAFLLSRLTNEKTVLFGVTVSGRPVEIEDVERMVGLFINTIPARFDVPSELTVENWLQHTQQQHLARDEYSYLSLTDIHSVSELSKENRMFDILFVFENYPLDETQFASKGNNDLRISDVRGYEETDFSLCLTARVSNVLHIKFNGQNLGYDVSYLNQLADRFIQVILDMCQSKHQHLADLSVLSEQEYDHLIYSLNQTASAFPKQSCIHQLFEQQVDKTPDHLAVSCDNIDLSYRQLNQRANQLAHHLISEGLQVGQCVGICLARTEHMIVAMLAVLKAGAAYLPLDLNYPKKRLEVMMLDSGLSHLISDGSTADLAKLDGIKQIDISSETVVNTLAACKSSNIEHASLHSDSLAYLIYTSGSTGKPKGVMVSHRNAVAMISWAKSVFKNDLTQVLAATSICFDISVFEIFATLSNGGSLCLVESAVSLTKKQCEVNLINTVPSAAQALMEQNAIPNSVTTICLAGELLQQDLVDKLYESGIKKVYDLYGPSEDTTFSTYVLRTKNGNHSIGKPIANTYAYILDENMQPVPYGVAGELYLAGEGVTQGYLNQPLLTSERFLDNPFKSKDQEMIRNNRIYRTGDWVKYHSDGELKILGRMDEQVKIRGFRIELGEIEQHINRHAEVSKCAVICHQSEDKDKHLIAFIKPQQQFVLNEASESEQQAFKSKINTFLQLSLPTYMLPSQYVLINEVPLNSSGKTDKQKLAALHKQKNTQRLSDQQSVEPLSETEEKLCLIWSDILNVSVTEVHRYSNFFELGGHSLSAVKLITQLRNVFNISLDMKMVFDAKDLATLAMHIEVLGQQCEHVQKEHDTENPQDDMEHFEI